MGKVVESRPTLAVKLPLGLNAGDVRVVDFSAAYRDSYNVDLDYAREAAPGLNCQAAYIQPSRCLLPTPLQFAWTISAEGRVIARGDAQTAIGGYQLGRVTLKPGQSYKLEVSTLHDATPYAASNLAVRVSLNGIAGEGVVGLLGLGYFGGGALGLVGLIWLAMTWMRSRRADAETSSDTL